MTVAIHWRRRHITDDRLVALREALAAHPGDQDVLVRVTGTGETVRLPVTVDPNARSFRHDVAFATDGACAVLHDVEDAF